MSAKSAIEREAKEWEAGAAGRVNDPEPDSGLAFSGSFCAGIAYGLRRALEILAREEEERL
jgi:hypothetical protein